MTPWCLVDTERCPHCYAAVTVIVLLIVLHIAKHAGVPTQPHLQVLPVAKAG